MGHLVLTISLDLMKSSEVRTAGDQSNCGRVKCFLKITEKVFIWQVKNDAGGWLCHDFFKEGVKKTTTTIVLHWIQFISQSILWVLVH